ncbi:methyl-accepting chemotaxis protein [Pusillimonas minor]|uniref:MCP four helix bundle domain-containing protein n=1 Tax=Pusillimonas minor TaxID=2697024 RepID=A0A842HRJ6_9BURK|nr:methyl-accepting chemotaxis protein [Pusillimonas minor]MBC2770883.1 MCP four helix bundle domain-containing protein [Pusillimonas minor]
MSRIKTLRVRTKLIGGFLIVAAIAAIIGFVGIQSMQRISQMTDRLYENEFVGMRHATEADRQLVAAGRALSNTLLTSTEDEYRSEYFSIDNHFISAKMALDDLARTAQSEEGKRAVEKAREAINAFEKTAKDIVREQPAETLGRLDTTERVFKEMRPLGDEAESLIKRIVYGQQDDALTATEEIKAIYTQAFTLMIGLTAGGALIAIILGLLITRGFTRQLGGEPHEVAQIAAAIAKGNLNNKIVVPRNAKQSIMNAMNQMQDSLRKVVLAVRNSSDHIATGSAEIATGNVDLARRTEDQAANLTETAAAMEQLASTVKSNADVAKQAAHMASAASSAAVQGGEVVNNVVDTMQEINASSRKIVDIISVIDSIAFQTNILALNAAVEAARAGEQGRGFAVVASEVRSLAQKSASAAKDIKNLIDNSVQKVDAGSRLVDEAGESMQGIVTHVKRVTDLINEISAATDEQTSGIGQVNDAVLQLSDVTQQNAALVQESAAASDSLKAQAAKLVEVVNLFDIGRDYIDVTAREVKEAASDANAPAIPATAAAQLPAGKSSKKARSQASLEDDVHTTQNHHDSTTPTPNEGAPGSAQRTHAISNGATRPARRAGASAPATDAATANAARSDAQLKRPDLSNQQSPATKADKEDDWEEF